MIDSQGGGAPDPDAVSDVTEFSAALNELRLWMGGMSYRALAKSVGPLLRPPQTISHSTVADLFKPGRRNLDGELVAAIVRALGVEEPEVARWRAACVRVHVGAKSGGAAGVFRQLPADLATFTGREKELAQLIEAATSSAAAETDTVVITAIEGMAGVGKTQLAVHAAHALVRSGRYADAQFYVNLRGFDADQPPSDPAAVLDGFLRQLGVPGNQIPEQRDARAAMFRDRLQDSAALIVLDNAADEAQVEDLIPAGPDCLVLITSRRDLGGLDGAAVLKLDPFSHVEAVELLATLAGADRVGSDPVAAGRVVDACGLLPLAVSLAGSRLRSRPNWSVSDLADRLGHGGLEAMSAGGRSLKPVFDLSYRGLGRSVQRVFRLLGLFPGEDFTVPAVAALVGAGDADTELTLERLQDEHLLWQKAPGRYSMHDLVRAYAADRSRQAPKGEREAAVEGMLSWYLATSGAAAQAIASPPAKPGPEPAPGHGLGGPVGTSAQAMSWFDQERGNLVALIVEAEAQGQDDHAWRIADTMVGFMRHRGHLEDLVTIAETGLRAARRCDGERPALVSLGNLTFACWESGRLDRAVACAQEHMGLARSAGDVLAEGTAIARLGALHSIFGEYAKARAYYRQALAIAEQTRDLASVALIWTNTSNDQALQGLLEDALESGRKAVAARSAAGDGPGLIQARAHLASVLGRMHRFEESQALLAESLAAAVTSGHLFGEAYCRIDYADVLLLAGQAHDARAHAERANAILDELNHPLLWAMAANTLGEIWLALGAPHLAVSKHLSALESARRIGYRAQVARALAGISRAQDHHVDAVSEPCCRSCGRCRTCG